MPASATASVCSKPELQQVRNANGLQSLIPPGTLFDHGRPTRSEFATLAKRECLLKQVAGPEIEHCLSLRQRVRS